MNKYIVVIIIELLSLYTGIASLRNISSESLPSSNFSQLLDSVIIYPSRSYSLDKQFYTQTGYQLEVSDKDAKSILIEDIDTTSEDYQKIIEDAKGNLANWLSKIYIYNSRDTLLDSLEFIFTESAKDWVNGRLIVNNTINFRYPAFSDKTGIIFFDYRNKTKHIYKSRNLRSIGKNNSETFYIVDSDGFIENFPTKKNDIIKLDSSGFSNITDLINVKYLSKINIVNNSIKENLTEYIEYFDGSNIIFINNIDDGQLISYKLERIINYPKRFTIIGDSIISLEEFGTILSTLIHDGNYSILMRKDGKKISCPDIYILNSFDIKLLIRLPEMIKPDCSPAPMCLCILDILAFDTNHILLYVFGELINPDNELIVFDIKKNKIIASPKLIDKGYPQN